MQEFHAGPPVSVTDQVGVGDVDVPSAELLEVLQVVPGALNPLMPGGYAMLVHGQEGAPWRLDQRGIDGPGSADSGAEVRMRPCPVGAL